MGDHKILSSGDVGFCEYAGHSIGIIRDLDDRTVVNVDCDYQYCGYADNCKLYKRGPVGYHPTYPLQSNGN
jgi:hypothetical protein